LPIRAVRYPAECSHVASVSISCLRHAGRPSGPPVVQTPLVWLYWPVRMLARLGQHHELVTNELSNVTPCCTSSRYTFGMICGVRVPIF
jgi:hypothetical protein